MAWFKKEQVPSIPEAPKLPELPDFQRSTLELPSLPSRENNMNNEIIKSAISGSSSGRKESGVKIEELPRNFQFREMREEVEENEEVEKQAKVATEYKKKWQQCETKIVSEPIFVRIEKFQAAQKSLDEIKVTVEDLDSILKRIREEKRKEDEEIEALTQMMEDIKSRLANINSTIFNKI